MEKAIAQNIRKRKIENIRNPDPPHQMLMVEGLDIIGHGGCIGHGI